MSWLRVDDKFHMSGKWLALEHDPMLWAACVSLWTMAGSWLSQSGEPHIQLAQLYKLCPLPREQVRAAAEALVDQARKPGSDYGLWERVGDGLYAFHDWHEYRGKSSAERVAEHRKRKAAQPELPAVSPSNADVTRVTLQPVTHETAVTVTLDPARGSRPDPTRPDLEEEEIPRAHNAGARGAQTPTPAPVARGYDFGGPRDRALEQLRASYESAGKRLAGRSWQTGDMAARQREIADALKTTLGHDPDTPVPLDRLELAIACAAAQAEVQNKRKPNTGTRIFRSLWRSDKTLRVAMSFGSVADALESLSPISKPQDVRTGRLEPHSREFFEAERNAGEEF